MNKNLLKNLSNIRDRHKFIPLIIQKGRKYMEGWIRIHRKLIETSWFNKSEYVHLWLYLLLKANHQDKEVFIGNEKVLVKRGQFLTSRSKLAEVVHIQENKIYRILKCFENEHQIEQQKTKKYTVISILNYDMYQKNEQVIEQQMNNKRTTNEQSMNTNNNDNNVNKIYLYFINKSNEKNPRTFNEKMKFLNEIQKDAEYSKLTPSEEYDLRNYILTR